MFRLDRQTICKIKLFLAIYYSTLQPTCLYMLQRGRSFDFLNFTIAESVASRTVHKTSKPCNADIL